MKKYISCGKCEKKYFFINLAYFINILIIFYLYKGFIKFNNNEKIEDNQGIFLFSLLTYIWQILYIIPEKLINRSMEKEKEKEKSENKDLDEQTGNMIELIFTDVSDRITSKDIRNIFIISVLTLIIDYCKYYISFNNIKFFRDFYYIEFFFLFLISKYFYKMKYYKHQYISIIIIVIFEIIKSIIIIIINKTSTYTLLKDLSLSFILSFLESICITYYKGLMLYKYFSPYKVNFIFGKICASITLVLFIIFSFIPVGDKIGFVKYGDKEYFDNFLYIFENYNIWQYIILIVSTIFLGTNRFLYNLTINYYSVCHLFLLIQTLDSGYILSEQIDNKDNFYARSIFHLCNIFELIFCLVFLELIEFNFCGLSQNIKKNINTRVEEDMNLLNSVMRETELFIQDNNNNDIFDDDETGDK